jgi:hypothetical protein
LIFILFLFNIKINNNVIIGYVDVIVIIVAIFALLIIAL